MNAIISLSDLIDTTGAEPRVLDIRLGEALGYDRPRAIRQTIERNLPELEAYGPAPRRVALVDRPQGGSVEVDEYHLNEPQALLVCMFARTPNAATVRKQIVDVFMAWRRGLRPALISPDAVLRYDGRVVTLTMSADLDRVRSLLGLMGAEAPVVAPLHSVAPREPVRLVADDIPDVCDLDRRVLAAIAEDDRDGTPWGRTERSGGRWFVYRMKDAFGVDGRTARSIIGRLERSRLIEFATTSPCGGHVTGFRLSARGAALV